MMATGHYASFPDSNHAHSFLPPIGQVRCYWTLLSVNLNFLFLDPVLTSHLADQAEAIVGRNLLEFVHPDEASSARDDLRQVIDSGGLHGSVTRVRYFRLSKVKSALGYVGPPIRFPGSERVTYDDKYMACDIVINLAAEGLVLCFIHAVNDINEQQDNDELLRTGWTNWCGTPNGAFDQHQIDIMYNRVHTVARPPSTSSTVPRRVFQILHNDAVKPLLFSFPQHPNASDLPAEFSRLARTVNLSSNPNDPSMSAAKTGCTRRYSASHMLSFPNDQMQTESIYIEHGSIIFACHAINVNMYQRPQLEDNRWQQYEQQHSSPQNTGYHEESNRISLPPIIGSSDAGLLSSGPDQQYNPSWVWEPPPQQPATQSEPYDRSAYSYVADEMPEHHSYHRQEPVPPQPVEIYASDDASHHESASTSSAPASTSAILGAGINKSTPPSGVLQCVMCGASTSPEWRKGPSGKKELCNACGLRWARNKSKHEQLNRLTARLAEVRSTVSRGGKRGGASPGKSRSRGIASDPYPSTSSRRSSNQDLAARAREDAASDASSISGEHPPPSHPPPQLEYQHSIYTNSHHTPSPPPPPSGYDQYRYPPQQEGPSPGPSQQYTQYYMSQAPADVSVNSHHSSLPPIDHVQHFASQSYERGGFSNRPPTTQEDMLLLQPLAPPQNRPYSSGGEPRSTYVGL